MGLREQILAAHDEHMEMVSIPEWGNLTVYVRIMTGAERDKFEADTVRTNGKDMKLNMINVRARLCVLCACDEKGKRIFLDADADALGDKSARGLDRIFSVAQRLNKLRKEDVEDLAKNSGSALSGASISSSPDTSAAPSPISSTESAASN